MAAYFILTILYVICLCTAQKNTQAETILALTTCVYLICGMVIPLGISVAYFKRLLDRPLIGYYVAPFVGLVLSLVVATPLVIFERTSTGEILF